MAAMTLQAIADRIEIDDLLTRYATALDAKDWDLFATLLHHRRLHRLHRGRWYQRGVPRSAPMACRGHGGIPDDAASRHQPRRYGQR